MVTCWALGSSLLARHLTQYIEATCAHPLSKYSLSIISKNKARIVTLAVLVKSEVKYAPFLELISAGELALKKAFFAATASFCCRVRRFDIAQIVPYHNLDVTCVAADYAKHYSHLADGPHGVISK